MRHARWIARTGCAIALIFSTAAHAGPYSAEYVFGDSLSDNGNLAEIYGVNFPNPPSDHDSFTNGPVAASVLATRLGLTLGPSLWVSGFIDPHGLFGGTSFVPGTNYAVAGATAAAQATGGPPGINLPQQVAAYSAFSQGVADPNALYFVLIGGNDVRNAALQGTGLPAVTAGVQAEVAAIGTLLAEGARNLLVVNVPDVGVIPEFAQDNPGLAADATNYSQQYDLQLAAALATLTVPAGANLTSFDLYAFDANVIANPASYGITDTTDRCFTNTPLSAATTGVCGPGAANIDSFFFWDAIHPTGKVQGLAGNAMAAALGVPEPSSLGLLGVGIAALALRVRRRATA